ncbi:MAG: periplasmic heavy metal sensor [Rhizomicrobium sp.]
MSDTPAPRRRNWLLIVSLCLNVALIAAVAIGVVRLRHPPGPLVPHALIAAVPEERDNIQAIIDAHAARIALLRKASANARHAAFNVFVAPDYSPRKMSDALAAVVAADTALETESVAALGDSLSALTPAERQAFADRVRKRSRSWLFRMFRPRER